MQHLAGGSVHSVLLNEFLFIYCQFMATLFLLDNTVPDD